MMTMRSVGARSHAEVTHWSLAFWRMATHSAGMRGYDTGPGRALLTWELDQILTLFSHTSIDVET